MKKQAFLGHSYSPADFKSSKSTVTWWPSSFGQSENFSCFFLVLLTQVGLILGKKTFLGHNMHFDSKQFFISKTS